MALVNSWYDRTANIASPGRKDPVAARMAERDRNWMQAYHRL